jgi:hypothetical protein
LRELILLLLRNRCSLPIGYSSALAAPRPPGARRGRFPSFRFSLHARRAAPRLLPMPRSNLMDSNPLFDADVSDVDSNSSSSTDIGESYTAAPSTLPTNVLQSINIKSHIPVELDINDSNYTEWRCFIDAFIGKFGIGSHLSCPPTTANRREPEWVMVDQCIVSWLYNTISKDVRAIIRAPKATTFTIWNAIHDQFRDHELHRAVYLEA